MKLPISINIVYHHANKEAEKIYSRLYKYLCRNPYKPLIDGLDIPVYYTTDVLEKNSDVFIRDIDLKCSEKTIVLLLVDNNIFLDRDSHWSLYIKKLMNQVQNDRNVKIIPVRQCDYAYEFLADLQKLQFINLGTNLILNKWDEFITRLLDTILRFLYQSETQPIKIFISHSKKDEGNIGEIKAKELRDYIRRETKFASFFDVNDVLDAYDFTKQLEQSVSQSLLVVLFTNTFSSREWCRKEVILAKKYKRPIVLVSMIDGYVDRVFPYIGNLPSTSFNGDWRPILNLLLHTALDQKNYCLLLSNLVHASRNMEFVPYTPEAYTLSLLNQTEVLYPEPPLGNEELEVLANIRKNVHFYTPMQYLSKKIDLNNYKIAISVSESEDLNRLGIGNEALNDLMIELSRHLLIANAKLVYGGDLRKDGFTELFAELSFQYGNREQKDINTIYVENYVSWPISTKINEEDKIHYKHNRVNLIMVAPAHECIDEKINLKTFLKPDTIPNLYLWGKCLTKMRKEMESVVNARILVGGKSWGFKGSMPGLLEEFTISYELKHPIYLVGGFGGVISHLCKVILGEENVEILKDLALKTFGYNQLLEYYTQKQEPINLDFNGISIENLNNGLNEDENKRLFVSTNIMEIVSLILKGLQKILHKNA